MLVSKGARPLLGAVLGRLLVALIVLVAVAVPAGIASAEPECEIRDPLTGVCKIYATDPGLPIPPPGGGEGGGSTFTGCADERLSPQPPPPLDTDNRVGNTWVQSVCYVAGMETSRGPARWVSELEVAADPRDLAQEAIAELIMHAPTIRTAPPQGSAGTVVGMPIWLWTEQTPQTAGPVSATASAGEVSVTATARVAEVRWDMGDGSSLLCGLGTPYPPQGTDRPSPDCGYSYQMASTNHIPGEGPWPVSATSTWEITWVGGGMSGAQTLELTASGSMLVRELFVLNGD